MHYVLLTYEILSALVGVTVAVINPWLDSLIRHFSHINIHCHRSMRGKDQNESVQCVNISALHRECFLLTRMRYA